MHYGIDCTDINNHNIFWIADDDFNLIEHHKAFVKSRAIGYSWSKPAQKFMKLNKLTTTEFRRGAILSSLEEAQKRHAAGKEPATFDNSLKRFEEGERLLTELQQLKDEFKNP